MQKVAVMRLFVVVAFVIGLGLAGQARADEHDITPGHEGLESSIKEFLADRAPSVSEDAPEASSGEEDQRELRQFLHELGKMGWGHAYYLLGRMYEVGWGVEQSYSDAVIWLRKAAKLGDADAQAFLGVLYDAGRGVSKDHAAAASWYRRAAEQDHPEAQTRLAALYATGEGVEQDIAAAVSLLHKAADQGYAPGQYVLARFYENGKGVPRNLDQAKFWYRMAAEQGDEEARQRLEALER